MPPCFSIKKKKKKKNSPDAFLFHGIDPQHLVNASLAVLFIECVNDP